MKLHKHKRYKSRMNEFFKHITPESAYEMYELNKELIDSE